MCNKHEIEKKRGKKKRKESWRKKEKGTNWKERDRENKMIQNDTKW